MAWVCLKITYLQSCWFISNFPIKVAISGPPAFSDAPNEKIVLLRYRILQIISPERVVF